MKWTEKSQTEQASAEEKSAGDTENDALSAETDSTDTSKAQGGKVLAAYFSVTNTTKGAAEHIVNGLNADIYKIVSEEP